MFLHIFEVNISLAKTNSAKSTIPTISLQNPEIARFFNRPDEPY